jgi:hypothetical protein
LRWAKLHPKRPAKRLKDSCFQKSILNWNIHEAEEEEEEECFLRLNLMLFFSALTRLLWNLRETKRLPAHRNNFEQNLTADVGALKVAHSHAHNFQLFLSGVT